MINYRFNFLSVNISAENIYSAYNKILNYHNLSPNYICFPDASVIKLANYDPFLQRILNNSYLTLPDGKPSQLAARAHGLKEVSTVSGYHLCRMLLNTDLTHYFYGGDKKILNRVQSNLYSQFPNAKILGFKSPPFVNLNDISESKVIAADIQEINSLKPNIIWIGISSPKQDYLMYHFHNKLDQSLMLGIGGVFLYFADESLKSPEWIKKLGLRWAYRLAKEPKRLWPKYAQTLSFLLKNIGFYFHAYRSRGTK